MKIAVLMGGPSGEREVSLNSGQAVAQALTSLGHETVPVLLEADLGGLIPTLKAVDLVFNALHGGIGENGVISGCLTGLGIPYTGSGPLAAALCMDKNVSKTLVRAAGLLTPDWVYWDRASHPAESSSHSEGTGLPLPVVVKPNAEGSTLGVSIVRAAEAFPQALSAAREYAPETVIETFIPGREVTVSIVGEEVYPVVEIFPSHEFYDYQCKYEQGMSAYRCPADLPAQVSAGIQSATRRIFSLLKCAHYARIDFRLDREDRAWFLEVNTLPGLTVTSLVPKAAREAGLSFEELIERILEEALKS